MFRKNQKERYLLAFGLGFLSLAVVLLPLLIMDQGYFIYYGDFVSQQLPFYQHANEIVRNGGLLGWDWGTDLGSSFMGSYAFYLTGSPFFWITVLLPEDWILYAIPWLLCLKHGIASLAAYGYIRYFVKNQNIAVIGGLLYAFSGFQIFNIFFNHFQDVTAFFPFMLIAMEEFLRNHRKGCFALSVTFMAILNYFFFAGQAIFLILYFLVRLCVGNIKITWIAFFQLVLEAILGVCIACVVLLPAAQAVLENSRVSEYLTGQDMILYSDRTKIPRMIQSFFMIPDPPARANLFQSDKSKWASIGGYLPLFSMTGVIAFFRKKPKHWANIFIAVCILCAFVPVLNSMFYMLNAAYYARWYYMPILVMAMMTAYALDHAELYTEWKTGLQICTGVLCVYAVIFILPVKENDELKFFRFASIPEYFLIAFVVSLLCLLGTWYLYILRKEKQDFQKKALILTTMACVACTCTIVWFGKVIGTDAESYIRTGIHGKENLSISYETNSDQKSDYFRIDISENYDNYPMFWGLSSMRCFQSVVSPSIMEFYDGIGITRDVASRADTGHYTLRGLFSVKYYFEKIPDSEISEISENPEYISVLPGFVYDRTENDFIIYKNNAYIPMGFTYQNYITEDMLAESVNDEKNSKNADKKKQSIREKLLIHALILDSEQAQKYSDILKVYSIPEESELNRQTYLDACAQHAKQACENFRYDSHGFSAEITLKEPKLVFFSVPYDSGWCAQVNQKPVDVEKVSGGFLAIRCEAGENQITFSYELPGLKTGGFITILGIAGLLIYLLIFRKKHSASKAGTGSSTIPEQYLSAAGVRASRAYLNYLRNTDHINIHEREENHDEYRAFERDNTSQ
ncbi:MAG: YfhO family protein [Oscillospiraceae bacterium]|nr:YfhO family protein [Oscillospiraceae bacterium]